MPRTCRAYAGRAHSYAAGGRAYAGAVHLDEAGVHSYAGRVCGVRGAGLGRTWAGQNRVFAMGMRVAFEKAKPRFGGTNPPNSEVRQGGHRYIAGRMRTGVWVQLGSSAR